MNDIVRRYARLQVPRYTSYPTAAEFAPAVASADQRRWLRELDTTEAVSVYLHVPYCRELCLYCGCNTKKAMRDDVIASYRVALEREIAQVSDTLSGPARIARLHWGGGTPSILGVDGLASVMQVLRSYFAFEDGFEHAIELDPRYVTSLLAESLKELGVNRTSLGVQDVNPLVQAAIGRWQPMQDVEAAVLRLRAAGIGSLNFDLIYGLPLQTIASLRKTCEIVAMLSPDRIACYGYAHMPRLKANQRRIDESTLPGVEDRIDQAEAIAEEFQRSGFLKIGIDHFARPDDALARAAMSGQLHRNFQGYTDDGRETLIGFGASSISRFSDGYVQNISDVPSLGDQPERFPMTDASAQMGKFSRASALVGWVKIVIARFSHANELRGINRAEFEQIARDLDLPPPELYRLLTGCRVSPDALEERLAAEFEASPQLAKRLRAIKRKHRAARMRLSVPIAPCC